MLAIVISIVIGVFFAWCLMKIQPINEEWL